jgi:hypothetical protein
MKENDFYEEMVKEGESFAKGIVLVIAVIVLLVIIFG